MGNIRNDLSERELSEEQAQDRDKWRRLVRNIHPKLNWENDPEDEED